MSTAPRATASPERVLQERMVALVRAFGLHRPEETPCGEPVSVSEAHALMELASGGSLAQRELADRLRLEKSTVSRLVSQLEARGLVQRARDAADGRAVRVALTARGEQRAAALERARRAKFARVLAGIPPDERDGVARALAVLTEAMRADA